MRCHCILDQLFLSLPSFSLFLALGDVARDTAECRKYMDVSSMSEKGRECRIALNLFLGTTRGSSQVFLYTCDNTSTV